MSFVHYGPAYERTQADKLASRARINPRSVPPGYFGNSQLSAGPKSGKHVTGSGGPGVAGDTERTEEASSAGEYFPASTAGHSDRGIGIGVAVAAEPSRGDGIHFRERAEFPLAGNHQSSRPALDYIRRLRAAALATRAPL